VPGDPSPPVITAIISGTLGLSGWYTSNVTVNWSVTDPESIILSTTGCNAVTFSTDTVGTTLACSAESDGGTTSISKPFKVDKTPPAIGAAPSRAADENGWYNHAVTVTFPGDDTTSGIDTCTQQTYAGPDDPSVSLGGTCRDRAGNVSAAGLTLKYDGTPPTAAATASRSADVNGWHNHALTVSFAGSDATSGLESCDPPKSYAAPDSASAVVTGSCHDRAGNVAPRSYAFKYDGTAPAVTATSARAASATGWYTAPIDIGFAGSDPIAGVASCSAAKTYAGPDAAAAEISGTCADNAGNVGSKSLALKYDATAPQVTASPSRPAGANGWYSSPVAVSFTASDATSGVDACDAAKTYSGPDSASAALGGSCRDKAGNSAPGAVALKYDATAPQVTAAPSRPAGTNGWYSSPLTVSFAGGDATSGLDSCDAAKTYAGPDSASTAVTGTCRDKAGNSGSGSVPLKYDATAPQVNASPSRAADADGWYNHALTVSFAGLDPTAGIETCDAAKSYSGPDSAAAAVSGSCRDRAGNIREASLPVKYDASAPIAVAVPAREPDANGWYNSPLGVTFDGTDSTSGIGTCSPGQTYAGPDTPSVSLSGSCSDRAGNASATAALAISYDGTAPQVLNAVAVRPPDRAGWYNRPVAFAVQGADVTSGLDACPDLTYAGPDAATASVAAACIDRAGNRGTRPFPLSYDATGPVTTARPDRPPDANGWYNGPFSVSFAGEDNVSGLEACGAPQRYEGPDSELVVVGGVCTDRAGNVGLDSLAVGYDATAPAVTGAHADRPPDANGWYNHPLVVGFQGTDATSQIEGCTRAAYAGPDAPAASVSGSCRDRAGNSSGSMAFTLRYDGTAPSLGQVGAKAGNGTAKVTWTASADTALVQIRRGGAIVYSGGGNSYTDKGLKNGTRYRYTLTAYDEAGNAATSSVAARPSGPLVAPAAGSVVSRPPRLAWAAVPKATYYNVQLWRRGKILSAWPQGTSLRLRRSWTYEGRRYRLTAGRYRWYVWAGYGRLGQKRFGKLLGSSSFVVR
jgi:hypothetical protein